MTENSSIENQWPWVREPLENLKGTFWEPLENLQRTFRESFENFFRTFREPSEIFIPFSLKLSEMRERIKEIWSMFLKHLTQIIWENPLTLFSTFWNKFQIFIFYLRQNSEALTNTLLLCFCSEFFYFKYCLLNEIQLNIQEVIDFKTRHSYIL